MTFKYKQGDHVVYTGIFGEIQTGVIANLDEDDQLQPYGICMDGNTDPDNVDDWCTEDDVICLRKDYDGSSFDDEDYDVEVEERVTLTDVLTQMYDESGERLEEATKVVDFEIEFRNELRVALEALE